MEIIRSLLWLMVLLLLSESLTSQNWKAYPYHQSGSLIHFPADEGRHPNEPTEWWYTVGHLTGDSTGNDYSYMLTYFFYPYMGYDGFRIFTITNETTGAFYDQTLPVNYNTLSEDSLNIQADPSGSSPEEWKNTTGPSGKAEPFQYSISASAQHGAFNLYYNTLKRPLILGDSGYFHQGASSYTYYYSQTGINVSGTFTFDNISETVSGKAWIDRQWGTFNPSSKEEYEWFSIHLSNGMDINLWNIFTPENKVPDTSTYRLCNMYVNDSTDIFTSDFQIDRLKYKYTPDMQKCYAQKWRFQADTVDLTITANHHENEISLPFRFFEGSISVQGIIGGDSVTGIGFAELLHSYEKPQMAFMNPSNDGQWNASQDITWQLLNPDQGRPVAYDLEISTDGLNTFNTIEKGITDTTYNWNPSNFPDSTKAWLKLTAYSQDTTLTNMIHTDSAFTILTSHENRILQNSSSKIYPNPANEFLTIRFTGNTEDFLSFDIFTIHGKPIVRNQKINRHTHTIDMRNKPAGVYLIRIFMRDQTITKKAIIH
ncbi:MAG: lipocalin-like domain-containing protein [Bacteroidales bacterium]